MKSENKCKVLIPYMFALEGGVTSIFYNGLPFLCSEKNLSICYYELCGNKQHIEKINKLNIPTIQNKSFYGSGIISNKYGLLRFIDKISAIPKLFLIARDLRYVAMDFDVIYVHGYRELLLTFIALLCFPKWKKPRVIWHCHGLDDNRPPIFLVSLASKCSSIIAISESVKSRLLSLGILHEKINLIHNAVNVSEIQKFKSIDDKISDNSNRTLSVLLPSSSLRPTKGLDLALDALSSLPTNIELWITGNIDDPSANQYKSLLDNIIKEKSLDNRVKFLGRRNDIYKIMNMADVIIVPSLYREGFGLVAAEAMALEKPVIVSNRGALPEVLGSDRCGWIFDPNNDGDLAKSILTALSDSELSKNKAKSGRERVEKYFNYTIWAKKVADVLRLPSD